jgi:hypothetical protein
MDDHEMQSRMEKRVNHRHEDLDRKYSGFLLLKRKLEYRAGMHITK